MCFLEVFFTTLALTSILHLFGLIPFITTSRGNKNYTCYDIEALLFRQQISI